MIKIRIIPALFACCVLFLTVLVSCGGEQSSTASGDTVEPQRSGNITFADIRFNEVTLLWPEASDNVTSAEGLEYRVIRSSAFANINTIRECLAVQSADVIMEWGAFVPSITVGSLEQEVTYWFSVLVRDEAGNISIYYPQQVRTIANTAPVPGSSIVYSDREKTSLKVEWGAATDGNFSQDDLLYRLVRATNASDIDTPEEAAAVEGEWTSYPFIVDVTGLTEATRYYFAVAVKNPDDKMSLYTPQMTTTKDVTLPVTGGDIYASNRYSDSLIIKWPAASDNLTSATELKYRVVMSLVEELINSLPEIDAGGDGITVLKDYARNVTSITVGELESYTEYHFAVVVMDEWGNKSLYMTGGQPTMTARTLGTHDPDFGVGSEITFDEFIWAVDTYEVEVEWPKASDGDDLDDLLEYRVVRSKNITEINTATKAAGYSADVVLDWTIDPSVYWDPIGEKYSVTADNMQEAGVYHFAVVVRDRDSNMNMLITPAEGIQAPDHTPPVIGSEDGIVIRERSSSMTVNWGEAVDKPDDGGSPQANLDYRLVIALNSADVDTYQEVNTVTALYTADDGSQIFPAIVGDDWREYPADGIEIDGLGTLGKDYYLAVVVKDTWGNCFLYDPKKGTTKKSWEPLGLPGFAATANEDAVSLKMNGDVPYIAYIDGEGAAEGKVTVRKFDAGEWVLVGLAGFSSETATGVELEIAGGAIYVAYEYDVKVGEVLVSQNVKVMQFASGSWGPVGSAMTPASYADLALGTVPYVLYNNAYNDEFPTVVGGFDLSAGFDWTVDGPYSFDVKLGSGDVNSIALSADCDTLEDVINHINAGFTSAGINTSIVAEDSGTFVKFKSLVSGQSITLSNDVGNALFTLGMAQGTYDGSKHRLRVDTYDSGWSQVGGYVINDSGDELFVRSMVITSGGPCVAYLDRLSSNKISVKQWDSGGSAWSLLGSQGFTDYPAQFAKLALDGSNTLHMAYIGLVGDTNPLFVATVMKYNGSSWQLVGGKGLIEASKVEVESLAFDFAGTTPYAAFSDTLNDSKASVMTYNGSSWVEVGTRGFTDNAVANISLALDPEGKPHVAYRDSSRSNRLTVMVYK